MAQCFVCAGDSSTEPLLTDLCDCRDLHLHSSCQRRLIAQVKSHSSCCAICKSPYRNVRFETRWCGGDDDQDSHADRGASNLPPRPTLAPPLSRRRRLPTPTPRTCHCSPFVPSSASSTASAPPLAATSAPSSCRSPRLPTAVSGSTPLARHGERWPSLGATLEATRVRSARGGRASVARGMALRRSLKR